VAGKFNCGQRDLCHLSEAQPQAGNRTKYAVKYGIKSRNNTSKKWGREGGTRQRRNNTSKKWGKEGGTMHDDMTRAGICD
jgi:hypothetical protein